MIAKTIKYEMIIVPINRVIFSYAVDPAATTNKTYSK